MKNFGKLLLIIGLIWAWVAFNADTTITTEGQIVGGTYIPKQTVHNIGKMDARRNHLAVAGVMIIAGVIFVAVGSMQSPSQSSSSIAGTRKCPFCAELVKRGALICRFCQRDLPVEEADQSNNQEATQSNKQAFESATNIQKGLIVVAYAAVALVFMWVFLQLV